MKKNDLIKIIITDVTIEAVGIGRFENVVIFVPNAMLGEEIEVKIIKITKKYAIGKIENIITPSKDRILPDCPHYKQCGGCTFRHMSYKAELKVKHKHICDCLKKIGGFENVEIKPIIRAENLNYYRNKTQIPIRKNDEGEIITGFFKHHSHSIVGCLECLLQPKEFNEIIKSIKLWIKKYNVPVYNEENGNGIIRHIYLRVAQSSKEIMVCLVVNDLNVPFKEKLIKILRNLPFNINSIILNINSKKTNVILGNECILLWGKSSIRDKLCNLDFDISPLSFYQVNKCQTEKLYSLVQKHFKDSKNLTVADLYCGIGTITLAVSSLVRKAIGVEVVEDAIKNAKNNAINNKIKNVQFICSDATKIISELQKSQKHIDAFILDPPRKGCSMELIRDIIKVNPQKVVYVSCNPSTLARDLKIFCEDGFEINSVTPVDMFPRTSHVETVVMLSRKEEKINE